MISLSNNGSKKQTESIRDYPRPPRIEDSPKKIKVVFNNVEIAESGRTKRILEKGHPPVYYIPQEDVKMKYLTPADNHTFCEWKGEASYYHLSVEEKKVRYACWYYPDPVREFISIKNYIAFYPQKMDACYIDDERVTPEPGKFYGGWITIDIVGPFEGESRT